MAGRSAESRFAGRDRRFADEIFAFVEIGVLFGNADDNFRRTGNAVAVPIPGGGGGRRHGRGRPCLVFSATREEGQDGGSEEYSKKRPASHWMRRVMRPVRSSTPKILQWPCKCQDGRRQKTPAGATVLLAPGSRS